MPVYRDCVRCGKSWNVSRIDPGPEPYICPTCDYAIMLRKRQQRKENRT